MTTYLTFDTTTIGAHISRGDRIGGITPVKTKEEEEGGRKGGLRITV